MTATRILAACSPGEVRVAGVRGDDLLDYALWRPGAPDGVGDLHRGRITARMPAMAGAFVALAGAPMAGASIAGAFMAGAPMAGAPMAGTFLPSEGTDGFLPDSEGGKGITEGTVLGVRVTRAAQGGKGPRLTALLSPDEARLAESGPVALLRRGPGAVERLAARYPGAPVLADDTAVVAALRPALGERLSVVAHHAFDDAIEAQVDALAEHNVVLPGGARLSIHPTPALVAIDMDLGGAAKGGRGKAEHHAAVNRALLPELARQIRLRNLSGAILVDLAGMPARRRIALGPAIAAALADDPEGPRFLGFTALGLAEIVRPRVYPPLHELLGGPHAAGLAALRQIAADVAARPGGMPVLRASPAVMRALEHDGVARADLARRAGRALILRADPSLSATGWIVEAV